MDGDDEVKRIINDMADLTLKFVEVNDRMEKTGDKSLMDEWLELNKQMIELEKSLTVDYGIEGDDFYTLSRLMREERPDAYGSIIE